jgi:hypothetical protein
MELAINIESVEKIYVKKAEQCLYFSYCEGKKEKRIFFGLIKNQEEVKPHWKNYWGQKFDTREDLIKQEKNYFINNDVLFEFSIWKKSSLIIVMKKSDSVELFFENDEEMYISLNELIEKSNGKLVVVK